MSNHQAFRAALSIDEACAALSVGRTTLYALVKGGKIRVLKVGTRTIVPVSEIDAFIGALMLSGGKH